MGSIKTTSFLRDAVILFLGVLVATWAVDAIQADSTTILILVALVLALLNMILKPLLVLFTLPFVIFTFGLGILLINAVLLYLSGQLVPGFTVPGFGAAFWGALIISLLNMGINMLFAPRIKIQASSSRRIHTRRKSKDSDVIDV